MHHRFGNWLALAVLVSPLAAGAEEPIAGHTIKESFAPRVANQRAMFDLARFAGADVPQGADKIRLKVSKVVFTGDVSPEPQATETLKKKLTAPRKTPWTIAEIFHEVHATEEEMAKSGFILSRLVIPPQKIGPGAPLTIDIVDGYVEGIDATALPEAVRRPVADRLSVLVDRHAVTRADIERAMLVAGDIGGLSLRSALAPGKTRGGVKLILEGQFRQVMTTVGVDHESSEAVGGWNATASVALNSVFRRGEQIYIAYQGDPASLLKSEAHMRVISGGLVVPVGDRGMTIGSELTWTKIVPITETGVPETINRMVRGSLRVNYPLVRTVDTTLLATASMDAINQQVRMTRFNYTLSSDSYMVMRAGLDLQGQSSPSLSLSGSVKLSKGIAEIGSVFADSDRAPPSHYGARPNFVKLNASLGGVAIAGPYIVRLNLRGQYAFGRPLYDSEQLGLDGSDALSSLSPGALAVDDGAVIRSELARQYALEGRLAGSLEPYLFGAAGIGYIHNTSFFEASTVKAANLGMGLRMNLAQRGWTTGPVALNVEVGHAWLYTLQASQNTRLDFSMGWTF